MFMITPPPSPKTADIRETDSESSHEISGLIAGLTHKGRVDVKEVDKILINHATSAELN